MQPWKILLADDDPEDRAMIQEAIEMVSTNGTLHFAENGEEALRLLHQQTDNDSAPCLIILDLNMPKMNGTETLRRIKNEERFKKIPVIIYSTSINPLEKEKCMLLGAHAYITKPVSFNENMETARVFLAVCMTKVIV